MPLAKLPPDLDAVARRWRELPRGEQDLVYAKEFGPGFAPLFASLPLVGAPPELASPRALVSVLGLSWQPVALMAAWAKPERMLVIGTKESFESMVGDERVVSLIARVSGVDRDNIEAALVGDPGEAEIYRAVRDFIQRSGLPPRQVFIDPTGGKKSMSASAALAGFLAGTPLVYVDYGRYHGRIPEAGTEYPRLLTNPLSEFGDLDRRDIFAAFNRGDFHEAELLATRLAGRLYEPREAECLAKLGAAYAAWERFDFAKAREDLTAVLGAIERFAQRADWRWAPAIRVTLSANLDSLVALSALAAAPKPATLEEGLPLVAWYLSVAERHYEVGKNSLSVLVTYAAIERYIDLCLWVKHGLDDEKPDYSRLEGKDLRSYHAAGRELFGKDVYQERPFEGPLMFGNGAQLLAALEPSLLPKAHLAPLRGLATARNKCEFEHGLNPRAPKSDEVRKHLERAKTIVAGATTSLDNWLAALRFPQLNSAS